MIRKAGHRATSNRQVRWQPTDQGAGARHRDDPIDGRVNGVEELDAQVLTSSLVPSTGEAVLSVRLVVKADERIHRRRSSASARRRTSSQGAPADSSARARRARRSISAAQAASTSAGRSAAASSRLARSSAATSARSSRGSAKASRSRSCARDDMHPFYTDRQPNTRLHPSPEPIECVSPPTAPTRRGWRWSRRGSPGARPSTPPGRHTPTQPPRSARHARARLSRRRRGLRS